MQIAFHLIIFADAYKLYLLDSASFKIIILSYMMRLAFKCN